MSMKNKEKSILNLKRSTINLNKLSKASLVSLKGRGPIGKNTIAIRDFDED